MENLMDKLKELPFARRNREITVFLFLEVGDHQEKGRVVSSTT